MKTFFYYENSRKRYRAVQNHVDMTNYVLEYRVKNFNMFGKAHYIWKPVVEMQSKYKFKEVKPMIDKKVLVDREIRSLNRSTFTNPFLEYINDLHLE